MASVDDHGVVIVARRLFIHNTDELADVADDHVIVAPEVLLAPPTAVAKDWSRDVYPPHRGLQEVVVIACGGLSVELADLPIRYASRTHRSLHGA